MKVISTFLEERLGRKAGEFYRFLLVGGGVTIISLILSYIFLKLIGTPLMITYVLIYISTIFLSYLLNANYTFSKQKNFASLLQFYGTYIITLACGTGGLHLLRKLLPFENWVLIFFILPVTTIVNFVLSSVIFKRRPWRKKRHEQ